MPSDAILIETIDKLVRDNYPANEPGVALIVVRDGEVLYRQGRGLANLELGVPIEPDMVFRLGSLTKQFTSVAILQLVEIGQLALSDPITKFLPDYPTHGHTITIEHLLTHSSGIKNFTALPEWQSLWRKDFTVPELIDFFKDQPMDFAPGERFDYSNSGYCLLGAILEQVSGQTYAEFIQQHIFTPLGMKNSCYDDTQRIIPRRVAGYNKTADGYINAPYLSMTQPYAAGALASSVDDLALWDAALYTEQLLKQDTLRQAFIANRFTDGSSSEYGYGWFIWKFLGHTAYGHGGGLPGFGAFAMRLPDDHVFVAAVTNNLGSAGDYVMNIIACALGQPMAAPTPVTLSAAALARYPGIYKSPGMGEWKIELEGQRLIAQPEQGPAIELMPLSADEFINSARPLDHFKFVTGAAAAVTAFEYQGPVGRPQIVLKM